MVLDKQSRAIVATKLFHFPGPESRLHDSTSPPSLVVQKMRVVENAGMHYGPTVTGDSVTTNPNLAPASLPGLLSCLAVVDVGTWEPIPACCRRVLKIPTCAGMLRRPSAIRRAAIS
jgi:hypothetical protein